MPTKLGPPIFGEAAADVLTCTKTSLSFTPMEGGDHARKAQDCEITDPNSVGRFFHLGQRCVRRAWACGAKIPHSGQSS